MLEQDLKHHPTINTVLSSAILALCTTGALATPVKLPVADTAFSATCTNIQVDLSTFVLSTKCQNAAGTAFLATSIQLNLCVANINGSLTGGAAFSATCQNIQFSGVQLSASCKTNAGSFVSTVLDLSEYYIDNVLSNINGGLTCP
ncbi:hypothetical protein B0H14DRAFT_3440452 [Mycena olivaceomarginata]|nr:hypothetical protein B0H14DRAFT_3440452 [Mycena olivaceomarginata]